MIDTAKKYLPKSAVGYSSPKLTIHLEDGIKFINRYSEEFDVIITDCSDYDLGRSINSMLHYLYLHIQTLASHFMSKITVRR